MGFWLFMLGMDMLVPTAMLLVGRRLRRDPPGEDNPLRGYRTRRSMSSREAWNFAQRYCGGLWVLFGTILLPLTAAAMLPVRGRGMDTVAIWGTALAALQIIPMVGVILPVEAALSRTFDEKGRRK